MKFLEYVAEKPSPADQIIDALVRAKMNARRDAYRAPMVMLTLSPHGYRCLMHTCDHWLISQGSIDNVKQEVLGCAYRIEPDQVEPFHIWVQVDDPR